MKGTTKYFFLMMIGLAAAAAAPAASAAPAPGTDDLNHKKEVRNAIGKNFQGLAECLGDFAATNPHLKEVDLQFVVWTNGQFYNVKLDPGDQPSEDCINKLLKQVAVPFPDKPKDYDFRIDLDKYVRPGLEKNSSAQKDTLPKDEKEHKRFRHNNLSMDLLTPVVTGAMGLGAVFVFEYEIAINRWVALSFQGMGGTIAKDEKIKIQGVSVEGTVKGSGGGGGGGVRIFPLGKAPKGLILGVMARAYMFELNFEQCPPQATEGQCEGELKNLDLLAEVGWRFILPLGFSILLMGEAGAQFGRSLYEFKSDPAAYFGGKVAVGYSF